MDTPLWRSKEKIIHRFWRSVIGLRQAYLGPRSDDEDSRRREYILNIILAGSIIMTVILDGIIVYDYFHFGKSFTMVSIPVFSIFPAFFIFLYALSRRGYFVIASYFLVTVYFIGNSYAVYRWGVNVPTALLGYALLIVIGSILISTRFAFFLTGAIGIYVLPVWYAQVHGAVSIDNQHVTFGDGIALIVLYFLIVLVAWLSNREIERSLRRARISERELKEERDSLEVKVDQRTRELQMAQLEKIDGLYRFAEFGQLASGLFHDLTSILSAVSLQAEKPANVKSPGDATNAPLENAFAVQKEIDHFVDAVRKQLSRESVMENFSLTDGIGRAVQLLSHKCNVEHVQLLFAHDDSPGDYFGNAAKFHQVIVNLLMNAIDSFAGVADGPSGAAIRAGKKISIRLTAENAAVVIAIEDNGCGIPAELQAKIFQPFFTTKHGTQGIGIGLAITKRIVENDFGGTITVESNVGEGSRFTIRFPLGGGPDNLLIKSTNNEKAYEPTKEYSLDDPESPARDQGVPTF